MSRLLGLLLPVSVVVFIATYAFDKPTLHANYHVRPPRPIPKVTTTFDGSSSSCDKKPCSYRWTAEVLRSFPRAHYVALTVQTRSRRRSTVLGKRRVFKYVFAVPGIYLVRLTVIDRVGRRASKTSRIVVAVALRHDPSFVGPSYWAKFSHGPPSSKRFFPICSWQTNLFQWKGLPARMRQAGINCMHMDYDGGNQSDLNIAARYGMYEEIYGGAAKLSSFTSNRRAVKAYQLQDEPNNTGHQGDPCKGSPSNDVGLQNYLSDVNSIRSGDRTRPIGDNLTTDVQPWAFPSCGWTFDQFEQHVKSEIQSLDYVSVDTYVWTSQWENWFDSYPNQWGSGHIGSWVYGEAMDRLHAFNSTIPVFDSPECCSSGDGPPPSNTMMPGMIESAVWDALVHGARGLIWWTTDFWDEASGGDPHDNPYRDSTGKKASYYADQAVYADHQWDAQYNAMQKVDREIRTYATDLNSPTVLGARAGSSDGVTPMSTLAKDVNSSGKLWLVVMADGNTQHPMSNQSPITGRITLPSQVPVGTVLNVVGENRTVTVNSNHQFTDKFGRTSEVPTYSRTRAPVIYGYQHHIYAMQ